MKTRSKAGGRKKSKEKKHVKLCSPKGKASGADYIEEGKKLHG